MLKAEAEWIGQTLEGLDACRLSPLLNVGSASAEFREVTQPWIHGSIFGRLIDRGVAVRHLDIQPAAGVDLIGDLTDERFVAGLAEHRFSSVLCSNVLEHVPDPALICAKLENMVPAGGYIAVSVPYEFPYHPDPIDTMFRPTVQELAGLFPQSRCVASAHLDGGTGWDYVDRDPVTVFRKVKRRLASLRGQQALAGTSSFIPWLFRSFKLTCVVLERRGDPTVPASGAA